MFAFRRFSFLVAAACLALLGLPTPLSAQVRAADATPFGGFATLAPIDFSMSAAIDPSVLPGCVATPGHDCRNQIAGRVYLPAAIGIDDGVEYPIIIVLHGNRPSCGRAYDPTRDRADLNSTPTPRIDDENRFAGRGACPAGPPVYAVVPSFRGYDYLGNRLASFGYVVVSVDASRRIALFDVVPGVDDFGLILARGRLVLRHLETLS